MKIKCLAIDDEPDALEKLCSYISRVPFLELVGACEDSFEAMTAMNESEIDAVFIDINMPDLNGLEFIASLSRPPLTVFITAYAEYAVESYRVQAVDYILKPYDFADFRRAADRLVSRMTLPTPDGGHDPHADSLFVKVDYRWMRIAPEEIIYIQSYGDYLRIFTAGERTPLLTNSNIASILKILPANFLQTHRSYIVNMDRIMEMERSRIIVADNCHIPIGDSFKAEVVGYIESRGVGKTRKSDSSNK